MSIEKINFDIYKIFMLLLYCYLILFVDCVFEFELYKGIKVLKNVLINELFFQGYFLKWLVMLGVLIFEVFVQVVVLLMFVEEQLKDLENMLYYFVGIDGVCFKCVVELGDQLILNVMFECYICGIWKFKVVVEVDGKVVVEVELMCMVKMVDVVF